MAGNTDFSIQVGIQLSDNGKQLLNEWKTIKDKIEKDGLKLDFGKSIQDSLKQITQIGSEISNLQKQIYSLNNNKININVNDLVNGLKKTISTTEELRSNLSSFGKVTINSNDIDQTNNKMKQLTATVDIAGQKIKLLYNAIRQPNEKDGELKIIGYEFDRVKSITDNTDKVLKKSAEQEAKNREKIQQVISSTMQKREEESKLLQQNQANAINRDLEQEAKERDLINQKISETIQKREEEIRKEAELQAKYSNKALDETYSQQQKSENKKSQLISSFGTNLGNNSGLNLDSNISEVEKYLKTISNGNVQLNQFGEVIEQNGVKFRQFHYMVDEGNNRFNRYTGTITDLNNNFHLLGKGIVDTTSKHKSFAEVMKSATESIMGFSLISGAYFTAISAIKEMLVYTGQMDNSLSDLNKVVDLSKQQLNGMREASLQMGEALSRSSIEISKAMGEAGRQFKNTEDIKEFVRVSTLASNVTDLSSDSAAKGLTTTMKSFHQSIGDVKKDIDSFNEIQNSYRTSAEDLIESIGKVGTASYQAKMKIHELNGVTTALVSATGITGSEAGTAIQAFISRTYALGRDGKEGKAEKTLNQIGLSIRTASGDYKSFSQILEDVHSKWDNLSNAQKMAVSQAIGSQHHFSQFMSVMENWQTVIDSTNSSINSQNSALNENSKYMESYEGKVNQLKVSFEKLSSHLVDSNMMKGFLDFSTSSVNGLDNLIQKFGAFQTTIGIIGASLIGFKKNMQLIQFTPKVDSNGIFSVNTSGALSFNTLKTSINQFSATYSKYINELMLANNTMKQTPSALTMMNAGLRTLTTTTIAQTVASGALRIATYSLNVALGAFIGMGIGLVIGKVVEQIGHWINKNKELKESVQQLSQDAFGNIQNNNQNIQQLSGLSDEYDKLKSKTKLTNEEQQRLNDIQNQIAQISPECVRGYDAQGNAIIKMNNGVKGLIDSLQEKNKLENLKLANGFDNAKENYNNDYNKEHGDLEKALEKKKELQKQIDSMDKQLANTNPNSLNGKNFIKATSEEQSRLKEELQKTNNEIDLHKNKLNEAEMGLNQFRNSLLLVSDGYDKLSDTQKQIASQMVNTIEASDLSRSKVQEIVNTLNNSKAQPIIKEMTDLQSSFKEGKISSDEFESSFANLIKKLSQVSGVKLSDSELKSFFSDVIKDTESAVSGVKEVEKSIDDLQKDLENNFSEVEKYGKFINEIKDKGMLSASSKKDIITKDPDLIPYLSDTGKLMNELNNRIEEIKNKSNGAFSVIKVKEESDAIQSLVTEYNNLSSKTKLEENEKERLSQLTEQLKGRINDLIISKDSDGKSTIKNIELTNNRIEVLKNEQKYLQYVAQVGKEKAKDMMATEILKTKTTYAEVLKRVEAYKLETDAQNYNGDGRMTAKQQDALIAYMKIEEAIKAGDKDLADSQKQVGDTINTLTEDTSKNTKSNKENTEMVKTAKNELKSYENAIKDCDIALKELNYTMGKMYEGSQNYIDSLDKKKQLLQEELNLTKQAVEVNSANANSLRDVASATSSVNKASNGNGKQWTGKYSSWINDAAAKNGLDPMLIAAIIQQESSFNPNDVNSSSGATGLGQFLASTAREEGITDRKDPQQSIYGLAGYLRKRIGWAGGDLWAGVRGYGEGTKEYENLIRGWYNKFSGGSLGDGAGSAGGSTTLEGGAEDIAGRIESLKSKALELQEAIDKIALEKFNAKIKQFDDQLAHVDRNKEMAKTSYDIDKVSTSRDGIEKAMKEKEQIWKEINWHYNVLTQKEAYINKELENTAYDEKTRTEMIKSLEEVKIQMKSTIVELHQEFESWIQETYNNEIKTQKSNIEDLERKLNILDKLSTKNYDDKISLNDRILNQNEQIKQKTLEQIDALQKLIDVEKEDTTREIWIDQQNKLLDQLDEINAKTLDIQQKNIELSKNKAFDAIEKKIYDGKTQEQYENNIKKQINALDDELEVMQKQNDALQERETRQKNLLDIAEAQIKLQEAQNNKNVQQLTKDSSGNWNFTYVANQQNVDSLEKELRDKMKSNSDWEKQTADKHKQDSLNKQKKALQDEINIRKEALDSIKHNIEIALQDQNNLFANGGANLNNIVNDSLSQLNSLYNGKFSSIVSTVRSAISQISSSILDMNTQIANSQTIIEDINKTTAQGKNNTVWVTNLDSPDSETARKYYSSLGYNIQEINKDNVSKANSGDVLLGLAGTLYGNQVGNGVRKVTGVDKDDTTKKAQKDALELQEKAGRESVEIEEKYSNQSTQIKQNANNRNTIIVKNATTGETMTIQKGANTNMDIIRQSWDGIVNMTYDKMGNMVVTVKGKVEEASAELRNLIALQEQAGLGSGGSRSQENHVKVMPGVDPHAPTTSIYIKDGITYYYDSQHPLKFDTGGETGDWSTNDGKMAMLHKKERVLSARQTEAFSDLVFKQLPELKNIIPSLSNLSKIISNIQLPKINLPDIGSLFNGNNQPQPIQQQISINAQFPNATNHEEIEKAFNSLSLGAIQYANPSY